jgi:uncharacterized YccA/Bax inhibitor family protein
VSAGCPGRTATELGLVGFLQHPLWGFVVNYEEKLMARNPMLNRMESDSAFTREGAFSHGLSRVESGEARMSVAGVVAKTGILLTIVVLTAVIGWMAPSLPMMIGSAVLAFIASLVIGFKPAWSPVAGPVYAAFKGYAVGVVSLFANAIMAEKGWDLGIPIAMMGTLGVLGIMLGLYSSGVIKVNRTFILAVTGASIAVALVYLGSFVVGLFWPGVWQMPIYGSGIVGIVFSVFVIGLAAFTLALDFHYIDQGVQSGLPKVHEWHAAAGLLITIIWLYLEILRLMMKLSRR